jgi:hypothetical protein
METVPAAGGSRAHPWASLRRPDRKGTPCPTKNHRDDRPGAPRRALRARPRPSQWRPGTSGSQSRRRTSQRPSGWGSSSAKTPPSGEHRLGAGARGRDRRPDNAAARPDRTAAAPARRSWMRAGGGLRAFAGEGRRERQAALRARQDHLRATDRATRPTRKLRRDQRLPEGRGAGHREGTEPDAWAASAPRPSVSRSRRSVSSACW